MDHHDASTKQIKTRDGDEQCGFVDNNSTGNVSFMVRMLSERTIELQKDLYTCLIDYTKAFDRVKHEKLLQLLESLDWDGKDICLLEPVLGTDCMHEDKQ